MAKGQTEMFEYVIAIFFIVLIVIFVIFMLGSYQAGQIELEKQTFQDKRTGELLKRVISSPLVAKSDGVLDDAKLTAALGMCKELQELFGEGKKWYALVYILDGKETRPCSGSYSTGCNYWIVCEQNFLSAKEKNDRTGYTVPVNVARKMGWVMRRGTASKAEPALIEVWTYE